MRPIKFRAWDSRYEFGSDGSVWSNNYNHTGERRMLRVYYDEDGYLYVVFNSSGKRRKVLVHRAIAKLFLDPRPSPIHQVNHKNGERDYNDVSNLEWVTPKENTIHGWKRGRTSSLASRVASSRTMQRLNAVRWGTQ